MTPRQKSSTLVDDIDTSHHDSSSPVLESLIDEVQDVSDEIPFSDKGIAWLLAARNILDQLALSGDLNGFEVAIEGGASVEYDAVQEVYAAFPTMIVLTLCVVFVLMGIFF
jgi:predicted RND superfamily exporter protein